jgi:hypothetical protein
VALTVGVTRDAATIAEGRGIRAARAVDRWRRTAAQDIGKLHPLAVRKRRHNVFAIRAESATGAPIAC